MVCDCQFVVVLKRRLTGSFNSTRKSDTRTPVSPREAALGPSRNPRSSSGPPGSLHQRHDSGLCRPGHLRFSLHLSIGLFWVLRCKYTAAPASRPHHTPKAIGTIAPLFLNRDLHRDSKPTMGHRRRKRIQPPATPAKHSIYRNALPSRVRREVALLLHPPLRREAWVSENPVGWV